MYTKNNLIMYIIIGIVAVILDQLTKNWALTNLKGLAAVEIIPDWLYLTYVENKGAAFGFLESQSWLFVLISVVFLLIMSYILLKYRNHLGIFYKLTFIMMMSGALGNLIDRIRYGYVIDFIFSPLGGLYNFPVFNLADVYLTIVGIVIIVYLLFFDTEGRYVSPK